MVAVDVGSEDAGALAFAVDLDADMTKPPDPDVANAWLLACAVGVRVGHCRAGNCAVTGNVCACRCEACHQRTRFERAWQGSPWHRVTLAFAVQWWSLRAALAGTRSPLGTWIG